MIGRGRLFISGLQRAEPTAEVYVVEEPELFERQRHVPFKSEILKETRLAPYQHTDQLLPLVRAWDAEVHFAAVVAGIEYGVTAAARAARALGLRELGESAAHHLTNKLRLRELCRRARIPHPRFRSITSAADVRDFFRDAPIVIKPTNLQASAGVIKVVDERHAERAFAEMSAARDDLVVSRDVPRGYLAEEFVAGDEVSVETLVRDGRPIFHNTTAKVTSNNGYFVELGHTVPADLPPRQLEELIACQNRLVAALRAHDGFLHAEWKLTNQAPVLVECAGRVAGDYILDLIEIAYGLNVYSALVEVMSGEGPVLPRAAGQTACVRFFAPPAGRVQAIRGVEALDSADPRLVRSSIDVDTVSIIRPLTSSFSRVGHVITAASNAADAQRCADSLVGQIEFVVG